MCGVGRSLFAWGQMQAVHLNRDAMDSEPRPPLLPDIDDVPGGRLADINSAILGWRQRGRTPESDARFLSEATRAYVTSAAEWPW